MKQLNLFETPLFLTKKTQIFVLHSSPHYGNRSEARLSMRYDALNSKIISISKLAHKRKINRGQYQNP